MVGLQSNAQLTTASVDALVPVTDESPARPERRTSS